MGSFWPKYILFELKKYREVILHDTEEWCSKILRKADMQFGKWQEESGKFSQEHWKVSKLYWIWWDPLSKVENVWTENLQKLCHDNDE